MTNAEIITLLKEYQEHLLRLRSPSEYDVQETRTFLNKNRAIVQRILIASGTLHLITISPPPAFGGYIMRNINPLDIIFDPPYNMDVHSHISDVIEQAIGIVETDPNFYKRLDVKPQTDSDYDVWALIHPSIAEVSQKRMRDGYYADAVEAACKALNTRVRDFVLDQTGEEQDGAGLMRKAFSPTTPIIRLANVDTKSGHDAQQGYMEIFAGVMTGIRNPKAHDLATITKDDALRKLMMISLLMFKIDGRIITE